MIHAAGSAALRKDCSLLLPDGDWDSGDLCFTIGYYYKRKFAPKEPKSGPGVGVVGVA